VLLQILESAQQILSTRVLQKKKTSFSTSNPVEDKYVALIEKENESEASSLWVNKNYFEITSENVKKMFTETAYFQSDYHPSFHFLSQFHLGK